MTTPQRCTLQKLTPALKKKWVEALRSGKYRQARSSLCSRDKSNHVKYCCLGVYIKICGAKFAGPFLHYKDGYSSTTLPDEIIPGRVQGECIQLNDIEKKSFKQIADYIEKEVTP
ncbi:MAG: hypothetical protein H0X04_00325 [Chthoniobacterales bacterium]|nr:hypothetical protein [Chthoniobacterales bacterium]